MSRVEKLASDDNINCRDTQGRNSTPLHLAGQSESCTATGKILFSDYSVRFRSLAAGYNNVEVCEYLLEHGADVNAQDKGGLIPLHNASSYGHVDIAHLLIKYNANVNAVDRWGFTSLHEASQKGRTQLCALLVSGKLLGYP